MRHKWVFVLLAALAVGTVSAFQTVKPPLGLQQGGRPPFPPQSGTAYFNLDYAPGAPGTPGTMQSLDALVEGSSLIVEGYVQSVQTPFVDGPFLHTDVIVLVSRVLKGSIQENQVIISQAGCTLGQFTQMTDDYEILKQGEHVVLFLTKNTRTNDMNGKPLPVYAGIPRLAITGNFVGLFRERGGKGDLSHGTPAQLRNIYQGVDLQQVLNDISARVSAGK